MSTAPKQSGFTLLEIVIALFIFTIVSLILSKALHQVISTQEHTEIQAEVLAKTQLALILFSRDIEQTIDRPVTSSEGTIEPAFHGDRQSLIFTHTGAASGVALESSMQRVRYTSEGGYFIRQTWPQLDSTSHNVAQNRQLLPVQELSFRYIDNHHEYFSLWPTDKLDGEAFPRGVEITLRLKTGGELKQIYLLPRQVYQDAKV